MRSVAQEKVSVPGIVNYILNIIRSCCKNASAFQLITVAHLALYGQIVESQFLSYIGCEEFMKKI